MSAVDSSLARKEVQASHDAMLERHGDDVQVTHEVMGGKRTENNTVNHTSLEAI